jgi:UDP-N-acetylmuramyl pentapeptide phosphotransferase/UDP-N-acetylglucosamine-1-phosphate transferase
LISVVSFIDDIKPLKAVLRLFFHLTSSLLVIAEFIPEVSVLVIPIILFILLGGVNAYNFMDGINGITSTYSLVILLSFLYLNQSLKFIDNDIIVLPLISVIVFSFFNFRKKALCFSGDVGSLSIALLILFILIKLIVFTQQPLYGLLLMVYAMDTALTMLKRKMNGENILKPHRSHLYQILANEKGFSHLKVSVIYGICQLFINYLVIFHIIKPNNSYFWGLALIVFTLVSYVFIKNRDERTIS